jgi:hypothetical protein
VIELLARRAAGLVLTALTAVIPIASYPSLQDWDARLGGHRDPSATGVPELVFGGIGIWLIIGTGLWWHRRRTTMWPIWARWAAFPGLFLSVITCFFMADKRNAPIALAVAAGLIVACWLVSEAVRLVLTRPVTAGLIASKLEIPLPTRGLKARVCIRADRLVLDSLASRRKRSRDVIAVPWTALRSVELIEVEQETVCQVRVFSNWVRPNTREFDVTRGPALHVVGTARELLIPVTLEVGQTALTAVRARSADAELLEDPFARRSWNAVTGVYPELRRKQAIRTDSRPYVLAIVGAFLLMPLVMLSGMMLSLITGSAKMQEQFYARGGVVDPAAVAILGVASIVFLYLLHRFVIQVFFRAMKVQDYIEAFPEPPPAPGKAGTVPGSSKKRKKP